MSPLVGKAALRPAFLLRPDGFILAGAGPHLRPGLMQGLAGVGQVLLERLSPQVIRPILALA